jgi:hypothetical protein
MNTRGPDKTGNAIRQARSAAALDGAHSRAGGDYRVGPERYLQFHARIISALQFDEA